MRVLKGIGIFFGFVMTGLLVFLLFLILVIMVLLRGPSVKARELFVHSCEETSAMKFLPRWFIGDEAVDEILYAGEETVPTDAPGPAEDGFVFLGYDTVQDGEISVEDVAADQEETAAARTEPVVVEDVKGATYRGKIMIVADPKRVIVGTLKNYGPGVAGIYLPQFVENYGAIGGTNAGGFDDPDGHGSGGSPDGIVIENGALRYGSAGTFYKNVMGLDRDAVLHVGDMTGQQALDLGIVTGVSFPLGVALIKDGEAVQDLNSGINPRTALGQCADGTMLLLVVEGRHAGSLGATFVDLRDIMLSYGAVNAAVLDGGTSSTMVYEGEQITRGSNLLGMRRLPTAILVLPEERAG